MAEGYMRYYAGSVADVHSAGTQPAERVHEIARAVMREDGIPIDDARPIAVEEFAGEEFDYVITVCDEAAENLPNSIRARQHIPFHLPDPDRYEGDEAGRRAFFDEVREELKKFTLKFVGREFLAKS